MALYECDQCDWHNPAWRYGFAEAGATWAEHMSTHDNEGESEQ